MNKVLFILPALPDFVPYVYNYFKLAERDGVAYDVVCWDRKGESPKLQDNYYLFSHPTDDHYSPWRKLLEINAFNRFVKRLARGKEYERVFTFTIADSVLLANWLKRKYKGRYVFDIRDYSPMVKSRLFRRRIESLLQYSALNVISSAGFKKWLPVNFEYVISHNVDLDKVLQLKDVSGVEPTVNGPLKVLTIGALRNSDTNLKLIRCLSKHEDVCMAFVGEGSGVSVLQNYCVEHKVGNVTFSGRYAKSEEEGFVNECDLINILLPNCISSDFVMANRFYLSVLYRKPMLVNSGCFHAELVKRYGLGLVIEKGDDIYSRLISYWRNLDWDEYNRNCSRFLGDVGNEQEIYKNRIAQFLNS